MHEKIFGSTTNGWAICVKFVKNENTHLSRIERGSIYSKTSTLHHLLLLLFLYFQYLCDPLNKMLISRYHFIINYKLLNNTTQFLNKSSFREEKENKRIQ